MGFLQRLVRGPHDGQPRHVESCAQCRLRQHRARQYLERLRRAEVPRASDDLTARLLARTEELARTEDLAGAGQPSPYRPVSVPAARRRRPALRAAALAAGGAAAATALLGGSAYLMGGDPAPQAGGAGSPVFLQRDLSASSPAAVDAGPGAPAGWSLTGEPDFTPEGALTAAQLATLRSEGWTCPEFRELGYHLVWARGGVLSGADIVELRLTDGRNFATIVEQHPDERQNGAQQLAPVNVLTGRSAAADGFTAAPAGTGPRGGTLWVNHRAPFAAIYQADGATFTLVSDQPVELADDGVAALVRAGGGPSPGTAAPADGAGAAADGSSTGADFTVRLERGLGRILELLAP
ncbi:hypothetical protein [Pseudarthrobacter sp. 1C304]|uniref:hypothetical protein n=1 Tax=Pseudarthrobacter sp. 1C304 TaxID=3457438 RepID=UPI003FD40356